MMKILLKTLMTLLPLALAHGCATEEVSLPTNGTTELSVGFENRTSLGEVADGVRHLYWSAGDMLSANGHTSQPLAESFEGSTSATFKFDALLNRPLKLLYPSSIYKDEATITLTNKRNALASDIDAPMYAYVESGNIKMKHLCGMVRISIRGKEKLKNINYISFIGGEKEVVAGDFTIDYQSGEIVPAVDGKAYKEVRAAVYQPLSTEYVVDAFIVVPARIYNSGFTIRIVNENGQYQDCKSQRSQTIEKGQILAMPEVEFVPTGTIFDVSI